MGNEMGNNNTTSALNEEDNASEAEKKSFNEEVTAESREEENQKISADQGNDAETKADGSASNDGIEPGNGTSEGDTLHGDGEKGENQKSSISETRSQIEEAAKMDSDDAVIRQAEKKGLHEEVTAESREEENQNISAVKGSDGEAESDGLSSNDRSEPRNETSKGDTLGDGEKGENHMEEAAKMDSDDAVIRQAEKKAVHEKVTAESREEENQNISAVKGSDGEAESDGLSSNDRSEPRNETSKGDTLGDDEKGENQMEEAAIMASDVAMTEPGKDTLEEDSSEDDDGKEPNQMIPIADDDAENVEENPQLCLTTAESTIMLERDSSKSDTHGDVVIVENQMPPAVEAGDVLNNDTSSWAENGTREGNALEDDENGDHQNHSSTEIVQEKAARVDIDDRTSELQDKAQKGTHVHDETDPISVNLDVLGNQSNVKDSVSDSGHEITEEIIQVEKSPNAGLEDKGGENCKTLTNFSLESTEDYDDKQIDLCKDQPVTYDHHHLDNRESSIKQEEENTVVLTPHDDDDDDDVELQESSQKHSSHEGFDEVLKEPSLQGTAESLQKSDLPDTETLPSMEDDGDISSDKEKETQENMSCGANTELGSSERSESEKTDNFTSIHENSDRSLFAEVNHITDHYLDSPLEPDGVDQKMCKELQEEMENSQHSEADIIINGRSDGDCNGEGNIILASDQVEELEVTEDGHQFDVCIDNNNTASDEIISTAQVQQGFIMVPENVEGDDQPIIPGSTVENCRLEHEENHEEKVLEEIEKNPEASEQFNSHLPPSGQKESLNLQNSFSISSHQENNVSQTKKFTSTASNNLDSSNLTMPALDMVDNEVFEREAKNHSQQRAEATSLKEAEIKPPEANLSAFGHGGYEVMESITTTRYSTESNPENPSICCLMQKSPSFNLNLRIEATTTKEEESSDHIALLLHDQEVKTAITESLSKQSSINLKPCVEYEQHISLQHEEEMPVEEKIVRMERSYSEKLHAPFLGLLKEEEEAHLLVVPKKQENQDGTTVKKEVREIMEYDDDLPYKGKEKRKLRPSFFSSCMCCMALTN